MCNLCTDRSQHIIEAAKDRYLALDLKYENLEASLIDAGEKARVQLNAAEKKSKIHLLEL